MTSVVPPVAESYPELLSPFKNKTVICLGGFSGIGQATAQKYYEQGARVVVIGLVPLPGKLQRGTELAKKYIEKKIRWMQKQHPARDGSAPLHMPEYIECNVTEVSKQSLDSLRIVDIVNDIGQRHGKIDVVVDSIGYSPRRPLDQITLSHMNDVSSANFGYMAILYPKLTKYMRDGVVQGGGTIITLGSTLPHGMTSPSAVAYGASKAGRSAIAKFFAHLLGKDKINVLTVSPSHVPTENERHILGGPAAAEITHRAARDKRVNGTDLLPEDVAREILIYSTPERARICAGQEILLATTKMNQLPQEKWDIEAILEEEKPHSPQTTTGMMESMLKMMSEMNTTITAVHQEVTNNNKRIAEQGLLIAEQGKIIKAQGELIVKQGEQLDEQAVQLREQGQTLARLQQEVFGLKKRDLSEQPSTGPAFPAPLHVGSGNGSAKAGIGLGTRE